MINKRKIHETMIKNNLHRLSDETLQKIYEEIEDEIELSIKEEMEDDNK